MRRRKQSHPEPERSRPQDDFTQRAVGALRDEIQAVMGCFFVVPCMAALLVAAMLLHPQVLAGALRQNQLLVCTVVLPSLLLYVLLDDLVNWLAIRSPSVRRAARSRFMTRLNKMDRKPR